MILKSINIENTDLIPDYAVDSIKTLKSNGFKAFLVGGCVRDLIIGRKPKDWDITTDATPDEIISLFPHTFYENNFGTVGVVYDEAALGSPSEQSEANTGMTKLSKTTAEKVLEITPFRKEGLYSDKRRPDNVEFSKNIEDDLLRRDFTMNAIAFDPITYETVDPYDGIKDIELKTIRAVGDAQARFEEDGLRVVRAVRFAAELGFTINTDTENALIKAKETLSAIAKERIRDEFSKIVMSDIPMSGIFMLEKYGLLKYVLPELEEGLHMEQNQAHSYTVYEHLLRSLQCAADKKFSLEMRIAALLHDIGKPKSRRYSKEKGDYTFYGHEVIGSKMAKNIMSRLKYPNVVTEKVVKLVRWHMFFSDTEEISLSAVRRMIVNVGKENIWDLMDLRVCDRVGTGRPKEDPYRLRKYKSMIDQVLADPISVGMLKIDGNDLIEKVGVSRGPKIGMILNALLETVLDEPKLNTTEYLTDKAAELNKLSESELNKMSAKGKEVREAKQKEQTTEINKKYGVK